jgi:hypothetical protein
MVARRPELDMFPHAYSPRIQAASLPRVVELPQVAGLPQAADLERIHRRVILVEASDSAEPSYGTNQP